jgi:hypothetical protein
MILPMLLGAVGCLAIGVWPRGVLRLLTPAVSGISGAPAPPEALGALLAITRVAIVLAAILVVVVVIRLLLLRGREVRTEATWACGYAAPTPRMQYTSASFSQPLLTPFGGALDVRVIQQGPEGFFPYEASFEERSWVCCPASG